MGVPAEQSTRRHSRRNREEEVLEDHLAALALGEQEIGYLRRRYVEYLCWLENSARNNRVAYYALRIPALVLAATLPALVAVDFGRVGRAITVALGIIVAAAIGVEHFLNAGQRWRHYRRTAEFMKSEAWLYIALAGEYAGYPGHEAAFRAFVTRAEDLMRDEVREYVATVVAEQQGSGDANPPAQAPVNPRR